MTKNKQFAKLLKGASLNIVTLAVPLMSACSNDNPQTAPVENTQQTRPNSATADKTRGETKPENETKTSTIPVKEMIPGDISSEKIDDSKGQSTDTSKKSTTKKALKYEVRFDRSITNGPYDIAFVKLSRPYFYIFNNETQKRELDLSSLNIPEGSIRISPDQTRVIIHSPVFFTEINKDTQPAVRRIYELQSGKLLFNDSSWHGVKSEPLFDLTGNYYFYREHGNDLQVKNIATGEVNTVEAQDCYAYNLVDGDKNEVIVITKNGFNLYNPDTNEKVLLKDEPSVSKSIDAWFYGPNALALRYDPAWYKFYKDTFNKYWSSGKYFFIYDDGKKSLLGWDKYNGENVFIENNIENSVTFDTLSPDNLIYTVKNSVHKLNINTLNREIMDKSPSNVNTNETIQNSN